MVVQVYDAWLKAEKGDIRAAIRSDSVLCIVDVKLTERQEAGNTDVRS